MLNRLEVESGATRRLGNSWLQQEQPEKARPDGLTQALLPSFGSNAKTGFDALTLFAER